MQSAAAFCLPSSCQGACGLAVSSNFWLQYRLEPPYRGGQPSRMSSIRPAAQAIWCSSRWRTKSRLGAALAVREIHDIVYREAPKAGEQNSAPAVSDAQPYEFKRDIVPDPVLLFRYSALTFNGHRIHYDRTYCEAVEGYPGLIVHGPLTATLLMDLFLRQKPAAPVTRFSFRARRPLFDVHPFAICGTHKPGGAALWALDHEGAVAMTAELQA